MFSLNKKILLFMCSMLLLQGCAQSECPKVECEPCPPCQQCSEPSSFLNEKYFDELLQGTGIPDEITGTFINESMIYAFYPSGIVIQMSHSSGTRDLTLFDEAEYTYDEENGKLVINYGRNAVYEYEIEFSEDSNTMWMTQESNNGPWTREFQRFFNQPSEVQ